MKKANERTLENLVRNNARVYVWLADAETAAAFAAEAQLEGFTYGDGADPISRTPDGIMALHADRTLNYIGFVGHLEFGMTSRDLVRVDYRRYIAGDEDYLYSPKSGPRTSQG